MQGFQFFRKFSEIVTLKLNQFQMTSSNEWFWPTNKSQVVDFLTQAGFDVVALDKYDLF